MMKKNLLAALILTCAAICSHAQIKRALIIAIGNYPNFEINKWRPINSLNDVPLIKNALLNQGFPESNISILTDEKATKQGIIDALNHLIATAGSNDIVVIHISSHGEQIEDDNVNEEMDGLDECIVPYGATYSSDKSVFNKLSDGYLRDDLFGEKITLLRNKLGSNGNVLVTLDACHSGTGIRGTATVRGNNSPMVSSTFKKKIDQKDTAGVFKDNNNAKLNANAATYVLISGAQAQEVNYECTDDQNNPVGSLSYAFSKAVSNITERKDTITYRSLFAMIEDVMRAKAPKQKPVLEGDGIDHELFSGHYVKQEPYFEIDRDRSNKDTICLRGGTVSGVTVGSVVGFYPVNTNDPNDKQPLQKGIVVKADNFTSKVKLDKKDPNFLKTSTWAFVTEMSYGNAAVKLGLDSINAASATIVRNGLKNFKLVEFTPKCDLYLNKSETGDWWKLCYNNTGTLFADTVNIKDTSSLKATLKRYARFRYLQNLSFSEKDLSAKVELVFLDANGNIDSAKMKTRMKFGRMELVEGDEVYLNITNTGNKRFCINIVDIQPDGKINPVIPNKDLRDPNNNPAPIRAEECFVERKETRLFKDLALTISKPYGEEVFKVFLSTQMLNLEDILTNNGDTKSRGPRGVLNNMARVFEASETNGLTSRGTTGRVNTAQDGTIFSLNFSIIEDK